MKYRPFSTRSLGSVLSFLTALHAVGCGAAARTEAATAADAKSGDAPVPGTPPGGSAESAPRDFAAGGMPEPAPPAQAPEAPASGGPPAATVPANEIATKDPELARAKQMVDIEARLSIEVLDVAAAAERLRRITAQYGGRVANEALTANGSSASRGEFTLRVPVGKADSVFGALDGLGVTRSRNVTARDVGKEYYDSVLRLRNLGVTRERLEEVLKHATEVKDILTIEAELSRVRGEMEQIEGQLRYLRDRAAFATIYVSLFSKPEREPIVPVVVKPEAKFFPGLRAGYLLDVKGSGATASYYGGGFVVGFSRQLDLHLDGFRRADHEGGTLDAFAATLGGRFHSEYVGGGVRRFLDPYLGLRGGYSRFEGKNEIVTGVTVGLEVWKTETVRLDLGVDGLVLFGSRAGAHGAIGPSLSFDVAF